MGVWRNPFRDLKLHFGRRISWGGSGPTHPLYAGWADTAFQGPELLAPNFTLRHKPIIRTFLQITHRLSALFGLNFTSRIRSRNITATSNSASPEPLKSPALSFSERNIPNSPRDIPNEFRQLQPEQETRALHCWIMTLPILKVRNAQRIPDPSPPHRSKHDTTF